MKIKENYNDGKAKIRISKEDWLKIGKETGWDKLCQKTSLAKNNDKIKNKD